MRLIETTGPGGVAPRIKAPEMATDAVPAVQRTQPRDSEIISTRAGDAPPVDAQRVNEIRTAIENGRYPVMPARIADAMIAAGILLRTKP